MKDRKIVLALIASLTLGLAPFKPEPHLFGKLRWLMGGGEGMQLADYFDLLMHGLPWMILIYFLFQKFSKGKTEPGISLEHVMKQDNVHIIDVRESQEVASGMVSGAVHMPLSSFDTYISQIQKMEGPKVLYCRSGNRSGKAIKRLQSLGVQELYNGGGYNQLKNM